MKSDTVPAAEFDPAAFSDDVFLGDALRILQPLKGARAGIDAVFLAAIVPARPGQHLLEAGSGSGVAGLCLLARHDDPDTHLTGVDIQANMVMLAEQNARRNGLAAQADFIEADITAPARHLAGKGLPTDHYDHVFANPPFLNTGSARLPPDAAKARAHALAPHELALWLTFLVRSARPGGTISLIHKPERLPELLSGLGGRAGAIRIAPLFPYRDRPASRVLVQAVKSSRAPLQLCPGLVLHEDDGSYSRAASAILRHGAAFDVCQSRSSFHEKR